MPDKNERGLLEEQLVAMLRMRGPLPKPAEEMYLDHFAKKALPDGSPAEIEQLKALWLMRIRAEQARAIAEAQRQPQARKTAISRRRRGKDPQLESLRRRVREMHVARLSQREMCERLSGISPPPGAQWRNLSWPIAYRDKRYGPSVRKWLSRALKSVTLKLPL
jgi:hypothetical protein